MNRYRLLTITATVAGAFVLATKAVVDTLREFRIPQG